MFYKNYNLEEWYKERIRYIKSNKKIYVPLCFFSLFLYLIVLYFNTKLNQSTQAGLKVYNKNWWDEYVLSNFFFNNLVHSYLFGCFNCIEENIFNFIKKKCTHQNC